MKIAVCDDNKEHMEYISRLAKDNMPYASIKGFDTADDMIECFDKENIDIAVLDIVLDGENGIEAAKRIHSINPDTVVIFISGYSGEYMEAVYEVEHIYFVKKPINENIFKSSLKKAEEAAKKSRLSFFIWKVKNEIIKIPYAEILYFESDIHNVKLITKNHKRDIVLNAVSLKRIEESLNPDVFVRCHQSFIVNILNYTSVTRTRIVMEDIPVPISRRYAEGVKRITAEERRRQLWS